MTVFVVRSMLPIASYKFISINGLQNLSEKNAANQMILALRHHLFPCVGLSKGEENSLLVSYGLLVDQGRQLKKTDIVNNGEFKSDTLVPIRITEKGIEGREPLVLCAPASGRYAMPLFTAMMLASISNMPLLARSAMAGDSLERHWLCVSALAASAAGTPALFTALLDSGRIAPLSRHFATEDDCNELNKLLAGLNLKRLPALPSSANQSFFVCDLQLEKADQQEDTVSEGAETNPIDNSALSKYVAAVTDGLANMKKAVQAETHIAAFRSPPRLPFADTVLFFNDTLYLFQAKDRGGNECRWTPSALREELVKMGAPTDGDKGSLMQKLNAEEIEAHRKGAECLKGLQDAWAAKIGKEITNTVFCFVTTHEHKNHNAIGKLPDNCKFVTVDGCSFIKFDKERSDANKEVSRNIQPPKRVPVELCSEGQVPQTKATTDC